VSASPLRATHVDLGCRGIICCYAVAEGSTAACRAELSVTTCLLRVGLLAASACASSRIAARSAGLTHERGGWPPHVIVRTAYRQCRTRARVDTARSTAVGHLARGSNFAGCLSDDFAFEADGDGAAAAAAFVAREFLRSVPPVAGLPGHLHVDVAACQLVEHLRDAPLARVLAFCA